MMELGFRELVENSPDTVERYDRDCRLSYANPAFARRVGVPLETLQGRTPAAFDAMALVAAYEAKLREVLETGCDDEWECVWLAQDGRLSTSHVRLLVERDAAGDVTGVSSIGRDITMLKETEQQLRESRTLLHRLTARREAAVEKARKEIAREMHEEYGQALTALRMNLSLIRLKFGSKQPGLKEKVQESLGLLDSIILKVRDMVSAIRPSTLNLGIASALEWLADDLLKNTAMHYELRIDNQPFQLGEERSTAVFRIVQEALTNVIRHAEAGNVVITLEQRQGDCRLEVRDDGKGFDLDISRQESIGLLNMEELSHMIGGELVIFSAPGQGTAVEVCLPHGDGGDRFPLV
ncbi:MAG TPA: ATP-binding protein [Gallionella sp.]|nr:ATP-binding protein [Gallionella sp.]